MNTTADLVAKVRERLDDVIEPFLVSTDRILDYLNWSQQTFCARTLYLSDASSFRVTITPDQEWVDLDEQIIKIRRLILSSGQIVHPLTRLEAELGAITSDYGPRFVANWRSAAGTPRYLITDLEPRRGRLYPIPVAAATGVIECFRYPELLTLTDDPEVEFRWHPVLIAGAVMQVFRGTDYEVPNPRDAQAAEIEFERGLAEATIAIERERRGPGVVRYNRQGLW